MSVYHRKSSAVRKLMNNPDIQAQAQALGKATEGLHPLMPHIAQNVQTVGARALQFLNSKLPQASQEKIGDAEYEAPQAHQRKWLRLHEIINDPISALDHVRHGTLTSEHMEALQQVHPELLQQMQSKVMEHMEPQAVRKLPSSTKTALGKFLGSPVSSPTSPQSVLNNQISLHSMNSSGSIQRALEQGPKSTLGGLKALNLGKRAATETTDLEQEPD